MSKSALTYRQQLDLLKTRGLTVADDAEALHRLEHHNYYRLSAYRFPFTIPVDPDQFKPGTTFAEIWNLYCFDRDLRQLVLEGCKKVEISARSVLAYEVGHRLGPLAYLENANFLDPLIHAKTLTTIDVEMSRSKETFIKHHKGTLGMPWPPVWVMAEVVSFGVVSKLLAELRDPSVRQAVASRYGLDEKIFCSWFHHLSVLRNTAAHHSRLWNRKFTVTAQIPKKKPAALVPNFSVHFTGGNPNERGIYNSLVMLLHLVGVIDPQSKWRIRMAELLATLDPGLQAEMDVPMDWSMRPLWAAALIS